jgi:signal transduction histidine kinase
MRLAQFIGSNPQAILAAWDAFARTILPAAEMDSLALRDHAADILLATVRDMEAAQVKVRPPDESTRSGLPSAETLRLNGASQEHAIGRLSSGFNLMQLVSEYRALRASVLTLWRATLPAANIEDVDDVDLFHESIDQSLSTAISCYTNRVEESRNMFLAILSHDLRNPLNSIAVSAQMLPLTGTPDAESAGLSTQITSSATVMARMISDLLDYTRTRLGAGMPVQRAPMNLATLCREVVAEFQSTDRVLKLQLESSGDLTGQWDPARLRQVFSNLLGNAVQHGHPHHPITLTLSGTASEVVASLHNHGDFIPQGELNRIFDPLVRGAATAGQKSHRPGSIGLGLYIARELITAHHGTIAVESSAETGTIFTIHLPKHPLPVPRAIHAGASLTPQPTP